MDVLWFGIAVVVVLAIVWVWRRRRAEAVEEWTDSADQAGPGSAGEPVPQVLDRDALVNRSRVLDPSKWDNAPEGTQGGEAEEPGDLPRFFDRDYLRRQHDPGSQDQG